MDLEELISQMGDAATLMKEYHGKMNKADNDEKRGEYKVLFEKKSAEFNGLKEQVEDAKALAAADNAITEARAFHTPKPVGNLNASTEEDGTEGDPGSHGKTTGGKKSGEFTYEAKTDQIARSDFGTIEIVPNYAKDQMLKGKIFSDWVALGPGAIEGEALAALAPSARASAKSRSSKEHTVRVPEFMAEVMRAKSLQFGGVGMLQDPLSGKVILSTDATGGSTDSGANNLLAPDFRPQLLEYAVEEPSLYSKCSHFRSINGSVEWPMLDQATAGAQGGVAFTWKATEGADKGETEPVFTNFTLTTDELSGWTELSNTAMRRSSIELQSLIMRLFRTAAQAEWSRMVLYGSGTNRPEGILQAAGKTTVQRAIATQVSWADLTNLEYAVPMAQRRSGEFWVHDTAEKYLKQQVDTDDRPIYTADVHSNIRNLLAGHNYTAHEYGAELGTPLELGVEGDVVFGNPKNYAFAMEEEITIARSDHVSFKSGRTVFRMMCFTGGKCIYPQHFAVLTDPA